jgi:capsule polysaccharide export protein KpsE/RkpR
MSINYTITADQQRAVHAELIAQYEREHIRLAGTLAAAESMGAEPTEPGIQQVSAQIASLEALIETHQEEHSKLAPTPANRVERRAARKPQGDLK